ncbi:hypothetical protein [Aquimarina agarivorans]|uniref:hypothetical protein n=1 Tax=Aquimarina agarivorans TaxID=980584 RepID=UPI000248EC28|nr:hypothetical protein [Aquimarina agarivorans]
MKKIILLLSLIFSFNTALSQQYIDAIKWEASTKNGGKFIGATKTKLAALENINNLIKQYRNSDKEILDFITRFAPLKVKNKKEAIASLNKNHFYFYLSKNDFITLKIIKKQEFNDGLNFYKSANNISDKEVAETALKKLIFKSSYLLKYEKPSTYLARVD